jgi:hypothetical protein
VPWGPFRIVLTFPAFEHELLGDSVGADADVMGVTTSSVDLVGKLGS